MHVSQNPSDTILPPQNPVRVRLWPYWPYGGAGPEMEETVESCQLRLLKICVHN